MTGSTQRLTPPRSSRQAIPLAVLLVLAALVAAVWANDAASAGNGPPGQGPIEICHNDGVNPPFTMEIVQAAWNGHAVHGDTLGACAAPLPGGGAYTICHRLPAEAKNDWIVLNGMPIEAWSGHDDHDGDRLIEDPDATAADCDAAAREPVLEKTGSTPAVSVVSGPTTAAAVRSQSAAARRACASKRSFRIRIRTRRSDPIVKAVVSVNGRRVRTLRGKRITAPVVLAGLPKGRYTVKIVATTKSGRKKSGTRRYYTCTPKRPGGIPPL